MKIDQIFASSEMGIAPTGNPRNWAAVNAARVPPHSWAFRGSTQMIHFISHIIGHIRWRRFEPIPIILGIINRKGKISAITKLTVTAGLNWITQISQNSVIMIIKAIPAENAGINWYDIDLASGDPGSGFYGFQCVRFYTGQVSELNVLKSQKNFEKHSCSMHAQKRRMKVATNSATTGLIQRWKIWRNRNIFDRLLN